MHFYNHYYQIIRDCYIGIWEVWKTLDFQDICLHIYSWLLHVKPITQTDLSSPHKPRWQKKNVRKFWNMDIRDLSEFMTRGWGARTSLTGSSKLVMDFCLYAYAWSACNNLPLSVQEQTWMLVNCLLGLQKIHCKLAVFESWLDFQCVLHDQDCLGPKMKCSKIICHKLWILVPDASTVQHFIWWTR